MRSTVKPIGRKDGQIMFIFCVALTVICLFAGLLFDVAIYTVQRVHVQTVADCSAYSGAVVQARKLNKLAELNNAILEEFRAARAKSVTANSVAAAKREARRNLDRAENEFRNINRDKTKEQESIRKGAPASVIGAMKNVCLRNDGEAEPMPFVNSERQLTEISSATLDRTIKCSWTARYRVLGSDGRRRWVTKRGTERKKIEAEFMERETSQHVYSACRVQRSIPVFNALRNLLGGAHRAYATAIPYGGMLWTGEEGKAEYSARLVRGAHLANPPSFDDREGQTW